MLRKSALIGLSTTFALLDREREEEGEEGGRVCLVAGVRRVPERVLGKMWAGVAWVERKEGDVVVGMDIDKSSYSPERTLKDM